MGRRERIEESRRRAGFRSQQALADAIGGTSQQAIANVLASRSPQIELVKKIAEKTGVSYEWLEFGDEDKAPSWAREAGSPYQAGSDTRARESATKIEIVGVVTAGNGDLDGYQDLVETVEIPATWKIVQVHGMSAYPVFYPRQLAWVDTARAARPETMTEREYIDLHDNVVVVQAEVRGKRVGLLKRFNYQPDSPLKFALSSLDAGRSSPYVPPESIDIILPVVGSWWEDPRRPRKKRYHARSVIVKLVDED
jgi:transcriptional regulator with XRE-family HTH domain